MDTARAGANAARVTPKLLPYMKARTRCQLWLGRTLRASDNLMQLCVHGGQLTYGNGAAAGKELLAATVAQMAEVLGESHARTNKYRQALQEMEPAA